MPAGVPLACCGGFPRLGWGLVLTRRFPLTGPHKAWPLAHLCPAEVEYGAGGRAPTKRWSGLAPAPIAKARRWLLAILAQSQNYSSHCGTW